MKNLVLYSSSYCPDCASAIAALNESGLTYANVDITSGMFQLKQFLKLRDNRPEFAEVRAEGRVGIPCLVVDRGEEIYFDLPENLDELR